MSTSECSSGCESGWTAYLEQSSNSVNDEYLKSEKCKKVVLREEDKDLSMVSDASSGPRHDDNNHDDDYFRYFSCSVSASEQGKMRKHKKKVQKNQDGGKLMKNSHLDDTASSPVFSFSKKNFALSTNQASTEQETQGFSTTHYKGKSSLKQHFGILKSAVSGNEALNDSGDLQGRTTNGK